jgi:hypothetical protein
MGQITTVRSLNGGGNGGNSFEFEKNEKCSSKWRRGIGRNRMRPSVKFREPTVPDIGHLPADLRDLPNSKKKETAEGSD